MRDGGIVSVVSGLVATDPAVMERDDLTAVIAELNRVKGWAEAGLFACKRRVDELKAEGRSESAASALTDGGRSGTDAKATEERAGVCDQHPEMEESLAAGEVSTAHLDVLARLTKKLSDVERCDFDARIDEIHGWACSEYVTGFERKVKSVIADIKATHAPHDDAAELQSQRDESEMRRWTDRDSGMKMTILAMDPLRDATFHTAIQASLNKLRQHEPTAKAPFGSLQIDAVVAATSNSGATDRGTSDRGDRIPEIVVHVDAHSTHAGRHAETLCETVDGVAVPPVAVERLCCEAVVSAVFVDADGATTRLCAEQRTANREQRRALAAMYSSCAHPHCETAFSLCRIHHVIWWSRGGKTILENLLPLCEEHHHLVHEGRWNLQLDPDRTVTWFRPDGTIWKQVTGTNRRTHRHSSDNSKPRGPAPPPADESPPDPRRFVSVEHTGEYRQPALC